MILDYHKYKSIEEPQKLENLIEIEYYIHDVNAKQVKQFLGILLHDKLESTYHRRKGLEIIARLTLLNRIGVEGTIDKLLDIEVSDDHFIILQAIKFSYHFYKRAKDEVIGWLSTLSLHSDPEIRSESYFALGRIHFQIAIGHYDQIELSSSLIVAQRYFIKSYDEIENRVDALLFSNLISFLLEALRPKTANLDITFKRTEDNLKEYIFFSINNGQVSIFVNLVDCLSSIKAIASSQPDNWLDFRKEFNEILIELLKVEALTLCKDFVAGSSIENYFLSIRDHLLNNILIEKFQLEIKKLRRVYNSPEINNKQRELINRIIELIDSSENSKKKDNSHVTELMVSLRNTFPNIPLDKIKSDLEEINSEDVLGISKIFQKYSLVSHDLNDITFSTGYSQGDEILDIISKEIMKLLPKYPFEKFIEFSYVLRDIVNYFINCTRGDKSRFGFLFKSSPLEAELQQSMLTHLLAGPRAGLYISEVKEFADGGRVDIVYNSPKIQIPIELKRSAELHTWESILNSFIGQAQTYAYSRDFLSFFILLDISPQSANRPESDIRSLFKVLSLPARQNVGNKISNYVISFIIPGNKVTPSERSKY